ncbi:hypothetical protein [Castellaniella sp.]|uniref:hypothetical protein n=1 Tax=Castellaniella sp. TaxID=1955812 RepID=UPI002AFF5339|nr:hypothetical protein [Castellaniella sp.]
MNRIFASIIITVAACTAAMAQEAKPQIGEWYCFDPSKEDARDVQFIGETWRVNNINIKDGSSPLLSNPAVVFSASIANRSETTLETSIEVLGLDGETPVFAISARPIFPTVNANSSTEAQGHALSEKGTLKKATKICIRAIAFAQK